MKNSSRTERILGVDFHTGSLQEACTLAAEGGLVVAPSAPGLAGDLVDAPDYRHALEIADLVLTDSSFLVNLWWLRSARRLPRHSGLAFLRLYLAREGRRHAIFWVMPSKDEMRRNCNWLRSQGQAVDESACYIAPHYGRGSIVDQELRAKIERAHPDVVILAIGGGVQERLGAYLRSTLSYRPGIFCLGAAIAFLSGGQVAIPPWVDRWQLGWLWRVASNPWRYAPRYITAIRLAWLVLRYGARSPVA